MPFKFISVFILSYIIILSLHASAPDTIEIFIVDGWDDLPVPNVLIQAGDVIGVSDEKGRITLDQSLSFEDLILKKDGYYSLTVKSGTIHTGQIIRIFPIMESESIKVPASKLGFSELEIASRRERIEVKAFDHQSSLGDLLAPQNGIFIKAYGGNEGAQSIAMRGLGAEQTLILLDGIPVNSGQTGVVDLQRYRLLLYDEVEIYPGGFSTMAGSGAIGGLVNISSDFQPDGITIGYERRAFDLQQVTSTFNTQLGDSHHNLRFGIDQGANHYDFKLDDNPGKRENSDYVYRNLSYMGKIRLNTGQQVDLRYHYGKFENGSPRALTSVDGFQGRARMNEENWLAQIGWDQRWHEDLHLRSQIYIHRNWFDYRDQDISVASHHFNQDLGGLFKLTGRLSSDIWLYTGIDLTMTDLHSSEAGNHIRRRFAVYGLVNWMIWHTKSIAVMVNLALREEIYSDFGVIFLPRSGVDIQLDDWQIYASVGRNFRAPTLNELHWQPGGNPDLQPERSFGFETGLRYTFQFYGDWDVAAGYYDITVGRMIKWYPGEDAVWRAQNIEKVHSNGLEVSAALSSLSELVTASARYKYGLAIKAGSEIPQDPTVGNRLPYIPGSEFSGQVRLEHQNVYGGVEISYTGFRYNTLANESTQFLPDVWVVNLMAGYQFSAWEWDCTVYGRINNISRVGYQLIAGYPLPLQTWILGMKFGLQQNLFE